MEIRMSRPKKYLKRWEGKQMKFNGGEKKKKANAIQSLKDPTGTSEAMNTQKKS